MAIGLITAWAVIGCATPKGSVGADSSVTLRFSGEPGRESETLYFNSSRILTYSDQQLLKDRVESVEFTVKTKVESVDGAKKTITMTMTTTDKDGVVQLHDLAFPEKDEAIEFIIKETGEVLKAGRYPPQSLFFVPAMPIPDGPVRVGDTWPLEHIWRSARDGIPLKLEIVAILKDIVSCERGSTCADIEVSGHVKLVIPPTEASARFSSRIWGRMLFSIRRGDVLWSLTRTREDMVHSGGRVKVASCMVSQIKTKAVPKISSRCEPDAEEMTPAPRY